MKIIEYRRDSQWVGSLCCRACAESVPAHRSSGMSDDGPHFYCSDCSNVILRDEDRQQLWRYGASPELLARLAATLPGCPCGGHFRPGVGPKCPHCQQEIFQITDAVAYLSAI